MCMLEVFGGRQSQMLTRKHVPRETGVRQYFLYLKQDRKPQSIVIQILRFFYFSIIRMNVLPECISKLWVPWKLEEDAESSGTGVTDGFGPPFGSQ